MALRSRPSRGPVPGDIELDVPLLEAWLAVRERMAEPLPEGRLGLVLAARGATPLAHVIRSPSGPRKRQSFAGFLPRAPALRTAFGRTRLGTVSAPTVRLAVAPPECVSGLERGTASTSPLARFVLSGGGSLHALCGACRRAYRLAREPGLLGHDHAVDRLEDEHGGSVLFIERAAARPAAVLAPAAECPPAHDRLDLRVGEAALHLAVVAARASELARLGRTLAREPLAQDPALVDQEAPALPLPAVRRRQPQEGCYFGSARGGTRAVKS